MRVKIPFEHAHIVMAGYVTVDLGVKLLEMELPSLEYGLDAAAEDIGIFTAEVTSKFFEIDEALCLANAGLTHIRACFDEITRIRREILHHADAKDMPGRMAFEKATDEVSSLIASMYERYAYIDDQIDSCVVDLPDALQKELDSLVGPRS